MAIENRSDQAVPFCQEAELGRPLTSAEKAVVRKQGMAVAVPEETHPESPTYGGKNTASQIKADAASPQAAAARDTQAMVRAASPQHRNAAQAAAKKIMEHVAERK